MTQIRILILEDVPSRAALMRLELRSTEISFISKTVETREDFVRELHDFAPDIILSSYYLHGFTGLEALAIAQESTDVPFILIMGELDKEHAAEILRRGATYVLQDDLSRLPYIVLKILREAEGKRKRLKDLKGLS